MTSTRHPPRPDSRLEHLLDGEALTGSTWTPTDLRAMLEHQLSVPLAADLVQVIEDADTQLSTLSGLVNKPPEHFGEALMATNPSIEHLQLIKQFAKSLLAASDHEMPRDLLNVLYYAAIIAALVRGQARITKLGDAALGKGCDWCLRRPWLTPGLRALFKEGAAFLSARG